MNKRIVLLATSALVLAACSSDDDSASTIATVAPAGSPASVAPETVATTSASPETVASTSDATETTDDTETSTDPSSEPTASFDETVDSGDVDERIEVAGEALADGNFTLMLDALNLSGVADEIRDREITVFAPNDDAFETLTGEEYSDLVTNPTQLDDVVRRHIVEGVLTFDDLSELTEVETIGGEKLTVTNSDGVVTVGGATIVDPDGTLSGDDGQEVAVFGIDRVLLEAS